MVLRRQGGKDGREWTESIPVDTVILCTGYDYFFPFLSDRLVQTSERRVHPLFLQLFHADHPSLSFIGIPHSVVPFPLFEYQAKL